jgi:nucleoside-diphosphate-sugar epimerase
MKKKVLLTGASGKMGGEAFKELIKRRDSYEIVLLLTPRNRKRFADYEGVPGLKIIWGDLRNFENVLEAVKGVDYVLHPAGLVAPAADRKPLTCKAVNIGGTTNLIAAIKRQPQNGQGVHLVYISSVVVYGDRLPPAHMLRVGDPVRPSVGDYYGATKIAAERAVIESGLDNWAILRQTYIAVPNVLSLMDPIMFHQPLNTHIELITAEDAGYGLVQTLDAPPEFYGRVYNMSGGPSCRVLYIDYMERIMKIFGMGDLRKIMSPNWFATRNFHCGWFADGDVLNNYLHHWRHTLEDHYCQAEHSVSPLLKLGGKIAPPPIVKAFMKREADPVKWIAKNESEKVKAFVGSREQWQKIPSWDNYCWPVPSSSEIPPFLDRQLPVDSIENMRELADRRGGKCLSAELTDNKAMLRWQCGFGHEFKASPRLLAAGHWCPDCAQPPWDYDAQAKIDRALGRLHYLNHHPSESQKVDWLHCPDDGE